MAVSAPALAFATVPQTARIQVQPAGALRGSAPHIEPTDQASSSWVSLLAGSTGGVVAAALAQQRRQRRGNTASRAASGDAADALCRRQGLAMALVAGCSLGASPAHAADKLSPEVVEKVKGAIEKLIKEDPNKGPTLVRLAWHASGTYDKISKTGGSRLGTIHFSEELAHNGNDGLKETAVKWLEPIKQANPEITYGDLYTLGGVTAIKTLGGPAVPWRAGRQDTVDPKDCPPNGRLPGAANGSPEKDSAHLRSVFGRMGFDDRGIVALSGAHALGRCHANASGFVGPWTATPTMFNNAYFSFLENLQWEEGCIKGETCTKPQFRDVGSQQFMMLPTDIALIKDDSFKQYVDLYAKDQKLFFADFSKYFSELLELGVTGLYAVA